MVTLIIDAIIDNYERKITAAREELTHTSAALKAVTERYERADDANIELRKANATLQRELSTAQLGKLRIMDHLIAVVSFVPEDAAEFCNAAGIAALRDALYAIPADAVTSGEQSNIDALVKALDKAEAEEASG